MWIVFLGAPGCGKGTQSERLVAGRGFVAISTGDLLRANQSFKIDDGRTIGEIIGGGSLLPDYVTIGLIKNELSKTPSDNVIFDGFPRTLAQAEALAEMTKNCGKAIDKVINFDIKDEVLVKRITGRFKCKGCGKIYNRFFNNTKISGVCDQCGCTEFESRADDNEDSLLKRLNEYHEKTYPLIDFYSKSGILCSVSADAPLDEVTEAVVRILNV